MAGAFNCSGLLYNITYRNQLHRDFGAKMGHFLHRKLPQGKNGAQMGHFRHRKTECQAVRRQKECFPAPEVASGEKWCTNGAFPAPEQQKRKIRCKERVFPTPDLIYSGKMNLILAILSPEGSLEHLSQGGKCTRRCNHLLLSAKISCLCSRGTLPDTS